MGTKDISELPFVIDQIVLVCNGCKVERLFYPKPLLTSAEQLIEWVTTKPTQCVCGAKTCDVKAHIAGSGD